MILWQFLHRIVSTRNWVSFYRGRGKAAALASTGGRGGGAESRVARSLDNRPTAVKVSGLPASAGEGDLRVHAMMAGMVVAAAMLDRPGEGVVKFAERWQVKAVQGRCCC